MAASTPSTVPASAPTPESATGAGHGLHVALYDGQCEICQACICWLRLLDRHHKTRAVAIDPESLPAFTRVWTSMPACVNCMCSRRHPALRLGWRRRIGPPVSGNVLDRLAWPISSVSFPGAAGLRSGGAKSLCGEQMPRGGVPRRASWRGEAESLLRGLLVLLPHRAFASLTVDRGRRAARLV